MWRAERPSGSGSGGPNRVAPGAPEATMAATGVSRKSAMPREIQAKGSDREVASKVQTASVLRAQNMEI